MELTEQELFDTEDLIRTVHKYELLDDRDGGIEAVTKFRKATEAKVREEMVERFAEHIYNGWRDIPGWVPWTPRGNSLKQDEARDQAKAALGKVSQ
jgi:hypothetical protein